MVNTNIIASETTWIEGEAVRQLNETAIRPGMRKCVGMPDLHPGKGSPIGAAFLSDFIYPDLIGTDIGCGMSFWTTDIPARRAKIDRIVEKMNGLDHPWDGDTTTWLEDRATEPTAYDSSLGTPGHGNHFIEVQEVLTVVNKIAFDTLELVEQNLCVTVHSGSRGFGESILYEHVKDHGAKPIAVDSPEGQKYMAQNRHAMSWAIANRDLCAHRTLETLRSDGTRILDICHNSVTEALVDGCQCWLHRKGAAPSNKGPVIIPGSRGDMSYLVNPIESDFSLWSLAHGAGRKISRGDAQGKLSSLYRNKDIKQNKWGGRVICGDRSLLWEESSECYKDITSVVDDLVDAGLVDVIATVRPLVTFKTSEQAKQDDRRDKKSWQRERDIAREFKRKR